MGLRDLLYETWQSLIANKGRSVLTILGIVIGISSVIAMTSLVGGMQNVFMGELGLVQARTVQIYSTGNKAFTEEDIATLQRVFPEYEAVTSFFWGAATATSGTESVDASLMGIDDVYLQIVGMSVGSGRLPSADELERGAKVMLIGKGYVEQLFGSPDAQVLGETIRMGISQDEFTIVGILEGGLTSQDYNMVYISKVAMQDRISGVQDAYQLYGLAKEGTDVVDLSKRTAEFLTMQKGEEVYAMSMQEVMDQLNIVMTGFSAMLTAIASISLFVGGIGIMNMMLTNVTERTREIGLRKSLGAHTGDIVLQFLTEAVALCLVGGLFGTIFGFLGALGLAAIINLTQALGVNLTPAIGIGSILTAVGVCAFIGVVFGLYPARRAAKLDPVESLRYQ